MDAEQTKEVLTKEDKTEKTVTEDSETGKLENAEPGTEEYRSEETEKGTTGDQRNANDKSDSKDIKEQGGDLPQTGLEESSENFGAETKKEPDTDNERNTETAKEVKAEKNNSESEQTEKQTEDRENVVEKDSAAEEQETDEGTEGKRHQAVKPVLAVLLGALLLTAAAYVGIAFFYRTHFFPHTSINGVACGNLDVSSVVRMIDAQILDYSLAVTGRDYATGESGALLGTIRAEDIELTFADTVGAVEDVLEGQNQFLWPTAYLGMRQESYSLVQGVTFSEEKLKDTMEAWEACQKKNMTSPEDAYISPYSEAVNGFEIIFEQPGTELDMEKTIQCVADKLHSHETAVDLEEMLCYTEANVKGTDRELADAVEKANSWLGTRVLYDWNGNEVLLDGEILRDWVTIEEGEPKLDEEAAAAFVKKQAKEFDTYGKRKKFTTSLGVELSLKSPNYGWKTDVEAETEELLQLIYEGSDVKREPVYSVKAQQKGADDIGNSYIEADLTHQHLYVYQDGEVVLETDFVSGKMNSTPGCVTPEGIFGLSYKTTNAVLRGADYETPVNYWMPFYGNYGMHDATWRVNFGGTIYIEHGSHGCINLPLSAAASIYEYVFKGSPVVCYYYEVDPLSVPVEGPALTEEELQSQEEPTLSGNAEQTQDQTQQGE